MSSPKPGHQAVERLSSQAWSRPLHPQPLGFRIAKNAHNSATICTYTCQISKCTLKGQKLAYDLQAVPHGSVLGI